MILGIYGIGGLGREILDMALLINWKQCRWSKMIFIDDGKFGQVVHGLDVISFADASKIYTPDELEISIGLGEPELKRVVAERVEAKGYTLATLIHPNAYVGIGATYGPGLVLREGAKISVDAKVGKNVCFENYAIIGHDGVMGDNCQISTYVAIAGNCHIGNNVFFGMNSAVMQGLSVGSNSIVSMGSMVFKEVPDDTIASGNPARMLGKNTDKKVFR